MGIRSVLVELDIVERYQQVQNFTNNLNQHYDVVGLIYHKSIDKYYVLVECQGDFFCKLLIDQFPGMVSRLEDFSTENTSAGNKIRNAIYFDTLKGCLDHYRNHIAIGA